MFYELICKKNKPLKSIRQASESTNTSGNQPK